MVYHTFVVHYVPQLVQPGPSRYTVLHTQHWADTVKVHIMLQCTVDVLNETVPPDLLLLIPVQS